MDEPGQLRLFPPRVQEVLSGLSLPRQQAELLFQEGFLSFSPDPERTLLPSEQAELIFVGTLAKLPLTPEALASILRSLDPPYAYSHERLYYDWSSGRWRGIPENAGSETEKSQSPGKVEWWEVEPLARNMLSALPDRTALQWVEEAWNLIVGGGLATYSTGFEREEAWIRFLALGEFFLDFSRQAWQIDTEFDYLAWGKKIGLDLLQIILMIGPEPVLDPLEREEEIFSVGLKHLMSKARPELIALLKRGSGGSKPLFLSLWRIAHEGRTQPIPEIFKGLTPAEHEALKWLEQICRIE